MLSSAFQSRNLNHTRPSSTSSRSSSNGHADFEKVGRGGCGGSNPSCLPENGHYNLQKKHDALETYERKLSQVFGDHERLPMFHKGVLTFRTNPKKIERFIEGVNRIWVDFQLTPKITFFNGVQYMGGIQGGRLWGTGTLIWLLTGCQLLATFNGCSISGDTVWIDNMIAINKCFKDQITLAADDHVFSLVDIRRLFASND